MVEQSQATVVSQNDGIDIDIVIAKSLFGWPKLVERYLAGQPFRLFRVEFSDLSKACAALRATSGFH